MRNTNLVIFMIFLNASAGVLIASGWAGGMGVQPEVGGDEAITDAENTSQNVSASAEGVQKTFIGNAIAAAKTVGKIFPLIYAGPTMISNLGIPDMLVAFVFAPMYIIVALDVLSVFLQYRTQS